MADEKKLRILIEAILKEKGFKDTEQAMKNLGKQTEEAGGTIAETGKNLDDMLGKTASMLGTFGTVMTVIGGAVTPIFKSADAYANKAGLANEVTREWLGTTNQLEVAQTKLGKVNAEFLLPMYSKFGDFVERFGNFAEENPDLTVVGELVAGATGAAGLGNIITGILGKLGVSGAAGASAGFSQALQTIPMVGVSFGVGQKLDEQTKELYKELTGEEYNWERKADSETGGIGNLTDQKNQPFWDKLVSSFKAAFTPVKTSGTVTETSERRTSFAGEGLLLQNEEITAPEVKKTIWDAITEFFSNPKNEQQEQPIARVAGQSTTTPYERFGITDKSGFMSIENAQAMMQFRKQEVLAQEDYQRSYIYAVEDFNRNRLYQEQDYQRQRNIALRNFGIQQAQTEKMFYLQRSIAQREFQISQERNDYDYHKNRMRVEEDYNFSLQQIMLSGDALAYYYAKRQHEIDERRAEEDYQLQRQRAQEDFNRSQADSLMFYQIQREFAIQQFNLSMADREVEYQIMRDRAQSEFYDVTLKRMDEEYKIMANRRLQSFYESIVPGILEEDRVKLYYQGLYLGVATQGYIEAATALEDYFNDIVEAYGQPQWGYWTPPSYGPQRASGGYTTEQMYQLHEHEFVLNRRTTESIESVAQGRLTQEKVLSLLTGGGGGLVYNDNRQFSRGLSPDERAMIRQELQQIVVEAFR